MKFNWRKAKLTKNQSAVAGFIKVIVGIILFFIALYCDIQFIVIVQRAFPDGIVKVFSIIGAATTGMSVLALVVAEAYWFTRGKQMVFGWVFTGIEVLISILNVIVSFQLASGHLDSWLLLYLNYACPATPLAAWVGWIIVLNLDENQIARHEEREMEQEQSQAERELAKARHEALMELRYDYLESHTTHLKNIRQSPKIQHAIEQGAWELALQELQALTGLHLAAQQHVEATEAQQPALPSPTPKEVTGHLQAAPRADSTPVPEFGTDEFKAWWKKYTGSDNPWKEGEDSPLAGKASLNQNGHVTPEKPNQAQQ